jgi:hypothetical protein
MCHSLIDVDVEVGMGFPLGAACRADGVSFSAYSKDGAAVELLLFDHAGVARPPREHSVFPQGAVWDPGSFDQRGVEPGQVLAGRIVPELESETEPDLSHDSLKNNLIWLSRKSKGF